jgi:hypothetical protein
VAVNQSTNTDSPYSTAKNIKENIIDALIRGGEPIKFESINASELVLLVTGGVTYKDFEHAARLWLDSGRNISGDWGYLKTVALRRAAEREMLVREALNG